MLLASQRLQGVYPMFEKSFQLCGVHGCPVEPFVMTRTNEVVHTILESLCGCEAGLDKARPAVEEDALHAIERLGGCFTETSTKPMRIDHGRRVEEGVALVDRDQIKLTRIRGALREEHIAVSSAVRVPQDNICQVEPKEGGRDPMRAAR